MRGRLPRMGLCYVLGLVLLISGASPSSAQSVKLYGGQTLDQWLAQLSQASQAKDAEDFLCRLGRPAIPTLKRGLRDPRWLVKFRVVRVLGRMGAEARDCVPELLVLLQSSDKLQPEILTALGLIASSPETVVPALRRMLRDGQDRELKTACLKTLGAYGDSARLALPELLGCLQNPDSWVRTAAATALGQLGSAARAHAPKLIAGLKDPDSWVRAKCIQALPKVLAPAKQAVPALIAALSDEQASVRAAALKALAHYGPAALGAQGRLIQCLKDRSTPLRSLAVKALGATRSKDEAARTALLAMLRDPKGEVRGQAVNSLLGLPLTDSQRRPVLWALMLCLKQDADGWVRSQVAKGLGQVARVEVVKALIAALSDTDKWVRVAASESLAKLQSEEHQSFSAELNEALKDAAQHRDVEVRLLALKALSRADSSVSRSLALQALADSDPRLRLQAVEMLSRSDARLRSVLERLRDRLKDPDARVRAACLRALGLLNEDQTRLLPAVFKAFQDEAPVQLAGLELLAELAQDLRALRLGLSEERRKTLSSELAKLSKSPELKIQSLAVMLIGKLSLPDSLSQLRVLLSDADSRKRAQAAAALGLLAERARPAMPELESCLSDASELVRIAAVKALGNIGAKNARVQLIFNTLLQKDTVAVRVELPEVMIRLFGKRAVPRLLKALSDDSRWLRLAVVKALSGADHCKPQASAALVARLAKEPAEDVRVELVKALGELRVLSSLPALERGLKDKSSKVRRHSVEALGEFRDELEPQAHKAHVKLFIEALKDPADEVRREAVRTLAWSQSSVSELATKRMIVNSLIAFYRQAKQSADLRAAVLDGMELVRIKVPGLEALLIEGCRDAHRRVRYQALQAASGLRSASEGLKSEVRKLVLTGDSGLRAVAVTSYQALEGSSPEALALFAKVAREDSDEWVRCCALQAISDCGAEAKSLVPVVLAALSDDDAGVREQALGTLAELQQRTPAVCTAVVQALRDPSVEVRAAAASAITDLEIQSSAAAQALSQALKAPHPDFLGPALRALRMQGPKGRVAVDAVLSLLHLVGRELAKDAAAALCAIAKGHRGTGLKLLALFRRSPTTQRRWLVLTYIDLELALPEAEPVLRACLKSSDEELQRQALRALMAGGDRRACLVTGLELWPSLSMAMRRCYIELAAEQAGPESQALLRLALAQGSRLRALALISARNYVGDLEPLLPALLALLKEQGPLGQGAEDLLRCLLPCLPKLMPLLASELKSEHRSARRRATRLLSVCPLRPEQGRGWRLVFESWRGWLRDPELSLEAACGLLRHGWRDPGLEWSLILSLRTRSDWDGLFEVAQVLAAQAETSAWLRCLLLQIGMSDAYPESVEDGVVNSLVALAKTDDQLVEQLRALLGRAALRPRLLALVVFTNLGKRAEAAIPELIKEANDEYGERTEALVALREAAGGEAQLKPHFKAWLSDADSEIRMLALQILRARPKLARALAPQVIALLGHEQDDLVMAAAFAALAQCGPQPSVLKALQDTLRRLWEGGRESFLSEECCSALGRVAASASESELKSVFACLDLGLQAELEARQVAALLALCELGPKAQRYQDLLLYRAGQPDLRESHTITALLCLGRLSDKSKVVSARLQAWARGPASVRQRSAALACVQRGVREPWLKTTLIKMALRGPHDFRVQALKSLKAWTLKAEDKALLRPCLRARSGNLANCARALLKPGQ